MHGLAKHAPLVPTLGADYLSLTMITPEQCRAARAWLLLSQADLAAIAGVSEVTIRKFERKEGSPMRGTVLLIHTAIERLGFELPDNGLMWRKA